MRKTLNPLFSAKSRSETTDGGVGPRGAMVRLPPVGWGDRGVDPHFIGFSVVSIFHREGRVIVG